MIAFHSFIIFLLRFLFSILLAGLMTCVGFNLISLFHSLTNSLPKYQTYGDAPFRSCFIIEDFNELIQIFFIENYYELIKIFKSVAI